MREAILEQGKGLTFVAEEYRLQLPDKDVLRKMLQGLTDLPETDVHAGGDDM